MAVTIVKRRLMNPQKAAKKFASRRAPRPARKNPGELIALGLINPQKGPQVKKLKKAKATKARKSNPFGFSAAKKLATAPFSKVKAAGRKKNPEDLSIRQPLEVLKAGGLAMAGLIATRQLPQLLLNAKNTGIAGYASNAAVAAVAAAVATKFLGRPSGSMVLIGGALYLVNRIMTEQFSPLGNVLSLGVGDVAACSKASRVGTLKHVYMPYPVLYDPQTGAPIIPTQIDAQAAYQRAIAAPPAAAPPSRISGVSRITSRFAG